MRTDYRRLTIDNCTKQFVLLWSLVIGLWSISSCTKEIDITIPDSAKQIVVDGTIENNAPPVVTLTSSQKFFSDINVNDLGQYFIHGATIKVTSSDGSQTELIEFCLQNLNLPDEQKQLVLLIRQI